MASFMFINYMDPNMKKKSKNIANPVADIATSSQVEVSFGYLSSVKLLFSLKFISLKIE